jgi:membrane fusion protein, multidrug efflux system
MRLGMTARVEAQTRNTQGLVLPLSALYRNGDQTAVWVVDTSTQTVKLVSVKATALQGEQIGVTEGLQGGETVVTAGVHKLHPGQKVRVVEATP